jgi:hypothetical protein
MALSTFELAQLGLAAGGAGLQAYGANQATKQNKEQLAMQRRLEAMRNQQNLEMQLLNRRDNQAVNFAEANPLGAEQDFARKQAVRAAILPALQGAARQGGGPTDPAIAAAYRAPANPLAGLDLSRIQSTLSPEATAASLADRRVATAGLDPTAASYRPSLSNFGLDGDGQFDQLVNTRNTEALGAEAESEGALRQMAMAQLGLTEQQAQELEKKGGSGFWKKLAKVGIIAGGAALMATGVGGPAGAAIIGAAAGAGSGAIDGGWRGALIGAGTGALTGGLGGGAVGAGAARAAGATTGQLVRSAILNPRTIAQMAGAGIGGQTGAAVGLASNFLPGANYGRLGVPGAGFEGNTSGAVPGFSPADTTPPTSPFIEGSRGLGNTGGFAPAVPQNRPTLPAAPRGVAPRPSAPNFNLGGSSGAPQQPSVRNAGFPNQQVGPFPGAQPSLPPRPNFGLGPQLPQGPAIRGPLGQGPGPFPGAQPGLPPAPNFGVRPQPMTSHAAAPPPLAASHNPNFIQQADLDLARGGRPWTGPAPAGMQPGPVPNPLISTAPVSGTPVAGFPGGLSRVLMQSIPRGLAPTVAGYGPAGLGHVAGGPAGVPATQMPRGFSPQLQQLLAQLPDGALRQFLMRGGR